MTSGVVASDAAPTTNSSSLGTESERRIAGLDGLRGIAILIVVVGHIALFGSSPAEQTNGLVRFLAANNGTGVDLFFVLSGFLITGILYDSRTSASYYRRFYLRRTLRIFPLYYFVLAGVALARVLFPDLYALKTITASAQIANWTYTTNIFMSVRGWGSEPLFLGHFWSLAVEEQFYLLWPVCVLLVSRERLVRIAAIGIVAALAIRIALITEFSFLPAYMLLPARMDALLIGAMIALVSRGPRGLPAWPSRWPAISLALAAVVADQAAGTWASHGKASIFRAALHFSITSASYGLLVVAVVRPYPSRLVLRVAEASILRFFGKYSYAIYIFHLAVIVSLPRVLKVAARAGLGAIVPKTVIGFGVLTILITIALALLSWNLLEKPFLDLKERLTRPPGPHNSKVAARS